MGFRFLILFLVIALNSFFAAAEVALISARKSRLRAMAERGNTGAQIALSLLAAPARLLSVTQVGVTLSSLGLGWAGEDAVYQLISHLVGGALSPGIAPFVHALLLVVSFMLITYAHVVIGEVVPKNLALEKADRLAILVAPALLVFHRVSSPFVFVLERSSSAISRWIGLRGTHRGGHSAEELKFIISLSRSEGHLRRFEEDAIQSVLELQDYYAREIMTPRNAIVSIPVDASLDEVLEVIRLRKLSRIPVFDGSPEQIIGFIHLKDLLRVWEERRLANERRRPVRQFRIRALLRKPLVVPETKELDQLIDDFRASHTHMAIVVDEFGTISGLVTLEDVLEQIFGEIADEYDASAPSLELEAPEVEVEGTTLIRDLDNLYGVELPSDAGFETLAGFLLFQLGYIPERGETVEYGGRRFTVLEMERNRIARVRIERMAPPAETPAPA
ncbi:MAG TPA: hemolysin family protein [Bryobacteraceae bacterium]|nr:hemolysin family protein [Bryobacteraceae bacterium]